MARPLSPSSPPPLPLDYLRLNNPNDSFVDEINIEVDTKEELQQRQRQQSENETNDVNSDTTRINNHTKESSNSNNNAPFTLATSSPNTLSPTQRNLTLFLYSLTTILLYSDQNLLAPNLTSIASDFGFTAQERDAKLGGDIALAFFLLGAPASFLVGCLADLPWVSRSKLFAITVWVGEGACFATYFTTTYTQLYICRALTGFSVGGALPLIYSILGDLFESKERLAVSALVGMGTGIGIALGQGIAGFCGPKFGWRFPFLVVSVPSLVCATTVWFWVKDPVRGGKEQVVMEYREQQEQEELLRLGKETQQLENGKNVERVKHEEADKKQQQTTLSTRSTASSDCSPFQENSSSLQQYLPLTENDNTKQDTTSQQQDSNSTLLQDETDLNNHCNNSQTKLQLLRQQIEPHIQNSLTLLRTPSVLLTLLQGAPGCIPWGIVNTYLNDYLAQEIFADNVEKATFTVLLFGLGNFVGLMVGGAQGNKLYEKDVRLPNLLSGAMAILGCIPLWMMLNVTSEITNTGDAKAAMWYIILTSLTAGICSGVTGPIVKATLTNVTLPTTRGQAFAFLNTFDDFGRGLGPVFVSFLIQGFGGSRRKAFNVGVFGWVLCGICNCCLYFTVVNDERMVQGSIAMMMEKQEKE